MASERILLVVLALALAAAGARAEPLIGVGVGNADTFASEATKLFNRKQYAKSAALFLKATRASPATVTTYVQLARALMLAKEPVRACYAYRVYLKAVPDSPDRKKAAAESDQCERLAAGATQQQNEQLQKYVDDRAGFFASLDKNELMGATGAAASFHTLVSEGFLGPELGDMGQKLGVAALVEADGIHKRALAGEKLTPAQLREARPLYQAAQDVGMTSVDSRGRMAYLDGLAELTEKNYRKAEEHFTEAAHSDPGNREYVFSRGVALFLGGERAEALKTLETGLKDDPRTEVLRATQAINRAPEAGAAELERILFSSRFIPEK
jgi:tetratricopeptide (TPR) repeat protein